MKVVEIFNSIEGEGLRVGTPCTFIRLFGCNLHCTYCDSRYACEDEGYEVLTIDEIIEKVDQIGCDTVTVTGGEPLVHEGIVPLLNRLAIHGYDINVETNGSVAIPEGIIQSIIFYTVDYKSLSSGMNDHMNVKMFSRLSCDDVIKCVVGSKEDLDDFLSFVDTQPIKAQIFISPIFGKIEPHELVEYVQKHKLWDWRVQVQLHKVIWDPDKRGV